MKSDGGEVILHYILYYVHDLINNWEFINLQWILQRNKKKKKTTKKPVSIYIHHLFCSKKKARQSNLI